MLINQWDVFTIFLYFGIGCLGVYCLGHIQGNQQKSIAVINGRVKVEKWWLVWFLVWVVFAVWRYVSPELGGTDAPTYIDYFNVCLSPNDNLYSYRTEPLFRLFTKLCKIVFRDYHIYFLLIYGVIVGTFIEFSKELSSKQAYGLTIIAATHAYILSFNTVRNSFSIGLLLIAIIYVCRDKYKRAFLFAILSVTMHTASVFYAPFVLFYFILEKIKIKSFRKQAVVAVGCMVILDGLCRVFRILVLNGSLNAIFQKLGLGQPFDVYASANFGDNFWRDFLLFRVSRPQLLLFITILFFCTVVEKSIEKLGVDAVKRFDVLKKIILYDVIMLPAVYWFHVWRGPEYFVLARVIVWGELAFVLGERMTLRTRKCWKVAVMGVSLFYLYYQVNKYWDMSNLTPYIFEPIGLFLEGL